MSYSSGAKEPMVPPQKMSGPPTAQSHVAEVLHHGMNDQAWIDGYIHNFTGIQKMRPNPA